MAFKDTSARKMPTLACLGRVQEVEEAAASKSGNYIMVPIKIEGYGASRSTRTQFMYRADWLDPNFNPESLLQFEGGNGLYFVYGKNINQKGQISTLKGVVGAKEEPFEALSSQLQALPGVGTEDGPKPEDVAATLRTFLVDEGNGEFGYILRQQRTKAGEDAEGKPVYTFEPYYEIAEFGSGDEKWREKQYKRAERTPNGSFRVCFTEEDAPFN